MIYNRHVKTKNAQIENNEFKKAEAGKEFKVDIITQTRVRPEPPTNEDDDGIHGDPDFKNKKRKLRTLRQLMEDGFTQLTTQMNTRFDSLEARVTKLETTLGNVITLNNLKS